jgi:hypothetical protein
MKPELRDLDIERELRRRAASVRTANGWATESLLPTVRATIETQPQRVPVARLAWLGGLAALFGVLLILAVGLPRLVDGPAASPTADPAPVVLSTEEFASKLTNAELDGSTVLVQGRIGPDLRRGPGCFLTDGLCRLGQLDGVEPEIEISSSWTPTVEDDEARAASGGAGMWQWWYMPRSAVEGILALSVRPDGAIEFLGRVHSSETTLAWAAGDVAELDLASLELDELVLVDGWLTQVPGAISCRPPDPGEVVPGLPSKYCGNSAWIAPEPVPIDPQGFTIPDDFVPVQHGAYFEFAEGPVADEGGLLVPRRATYGLARRLYGGGCPDGEPPCWDWQLIGRVSTLMAAPSSTPEASATPSPEPSQLPMSPSLAPPPIEPEPSPSPSPRTLITCEPAGPSELDGEPRAVTVDDETGLVDRCNLVEGAPGGVTADFLDGAFVQNLDGDQTRLAVLVGSSICDRNAVISLRQSEGRYLLNIDKPDADTLCRAKFAPYSVVLDLRAPIAAKLVDATWTGARMVPSPSPVAPGLPSTIECPYLEIDPAVNVTLTDHTAVVLGCEATVAAERADDDGTIWVTNPDGNRLRLAVGWDRRGLCASSPADLELWRTAGAYLLTVHLQDTGGPGPCTEGGFQGVNLSLRSPIRADAIDAFVWQEGSDVIDLNSAGEYELGISAGSATYSTEEAIDVEATLTYTGEAADSPSLWGNTLVYFRVEQVDGDLQLWPVLLDSCERFEPLQQDRPMRVPFWKGGFAVPDSDDPDADFLSSYYAQPELRLPVGTWRITAVGSFGVGDCGTGSIDMSTSIIVRVR